MGRLAAFRPAVPHAIGRGQPEQLAVNLRFNFLVLAASSLVLAGAATAQEAASPNAASPNGAHAAGGTNLSDNPADLAFIGAMRDMMVGMHKNMPTGDTDRDFVRMMVPHHQSAVEMAKAELQYGKDKDLKELAQSIITDQDREIALMKAWQDKHSK